MKRAILSFAIATIIAIGNNTTMSAQDYVSTPVTLSKEKVKIDGKIFYSHIVLEKQTLYSISKAYEVSTEEIYKYNPTLKETGLKKNSIILIPVQDAANRTAANSSIDKTETNHQKEDVQKKEFAPRNATTEARNAEQQSVESEGKASRMREISRATDAKEQKTNQENFSKPGKDRQKKKGRIHTVKWYEDLETIADKYGVTVEAIMKANNLTGRKLTNRQKLTIPSAEEMETLLEESKVATEHSSRQEYENIKTDSIAKGNEKAEEIFHKNLFRKDRTDVTLVLPLKADGYTCSRNNMDFYAGVLIAVQELGEKGMNINLRVNDLSDHNNAVTADMLGESDVVIGPVSSGHISNMLNLAAGNCQIVSPLDPRTEQLAHSNWNLIQVPTPHKILYRELAEWIKKENGGSDSIIFITEKAARDTETYSMMRSAADSAGLSYNTFSYSILEGRNILEPLSALMTDKGMNRFVVASESEAFVNDVVRNLNLLIHNKYNVTLYAPGKIRNFETMEVENLHNTNLHICIGYDIDYNDQQVRNFLMKFRALYNAEPSQFAFQGYDIANYYIRLCHKYGRRWAETLDRNDEEMLQSTFKFRRIENGGWVNEGVRKIVYGKDWSINRL